MVSGVIFDLDGTLLNTMPSILFHVNDTLREAGLSPISYEECRTFIGHGARRLISRAFAARGVTDDATVARALARYNAAYDADPYVGTCPYDGVHDVLVALAERGVSISVVSNKPQPTVERLLRHFFADVSIHPIVGGRDDLPLKPHPAVGRFVLDALCLRAQSVAVVGDSDVDMQFAHAIGARAVGVSWGFRSTECLQAADAHAIVDTADALFRLLTDF